MADQENALAATKVEELEAALAKETDVAAVRIAMGADTRVTARPLYEARIAALGPTATKSTGSSAKREAATRVKYEGKWYAPGDEVPFTSAKAAEPYDATGSLVALPEKK